MQLTASLSAAFVIIAVTTAGLKQGTGRWLVSHRQGAGAALTRQASANVGAPRPNMLRAYRVCQGKQLLPRPLLLQASVQHAVA